MSDTHVHDEAVLIRTESGQRATFDEIEFDAAHRRLLLLVNGFTPLGNLTARLDPRHDWHATARTLIDRNLIALTQPADAAMG